jgi:hypothetical protein
MIVIAVIGLRGLGGALFLPRGQPSAVVDTVS